jgi:C4-dicarboxylate transporter/malic acid transport protein
LALVFWGLGALLTVVFSVAVPFVMFMGEHVELSHINPSWFIPPVALLVVPIAGAPISAQLSGFWHEFALVLNYFCWGAGFFNYLALLAVCIYRFILHHPLPNVMVPTVWINLGPVGAGTVALLNLIKFSDFVAVKEPFYVFGLLFWGFGIWWTMVSLLMLLYYARVFSLPYAMSWWAFTFPLGAYVAASHLVGVSLGLKTVDFVGFVLYWLLLFFWTVTLLKTAVHTYTGAVFKRS